MTDDGTKMWPIPIIFIIFIVFSVLFIFIICFDIKGSSEPDTFGKIRFVEEKNPETVNGYTLCNYADGTRRNCFQIDDYKLECTRIEGVCDKQECYLYDNSGNDIWKKTKRGNSSFYINSDGTSKLVNFGPCEGPAHGVGYIEFYDASGKTTKVIERPCTPTDKGCLMFRELFNLPYQGYSLLYDDNHLSMMCIDKIGKQLWKIQELQEGTISLSRTGKYLFNEIWRFHNKKINSKYGAYGILIFDTSTGDFVTTISCSDWCYVLDATDEKEYSGFMLLEESDRNQLEKADIKLVYMDHSNTKTLYDYSASDNRINGDYSFGLRLMDGKILASGEYVALFFEQYKQHAYNSDWSALGYLVVLDKHGEIVLRKELGEYIRKYPYEYARILPKDSNKFEVRLWNEVFVFNIEQ